jgi:hypothetical protein
LPHLHISLSYTAASPFIGGALILLVGSFVQEYMITRYCRDRHDETLKARLIKDGDLVQLICTYLAVVPPGIAYANGNRGLLTFMVLGGFIGIVVSAVKLLNAPSYKYYAWRKFEIITPGTAAGLVFCAIGGVYALFWGS